MINNTHLLLNVCVALSAASLMTSLLGLYFSIKSSRKRRYTRKAKS